MGKLIADKAIQKFVIAMTVLVIFAGLAALWTWKPPQLPGDLAGTIWGGLLLLTGAIGNDYFKLLTQHEVDSSVNKEQ